MPKSSGNFASRDLWNAASINNYQPLNQRKPEMPNLLGKNQPKQIGLDFGVFKQ